MTFLREKCDFGLPGSCFDRDGQPLDMWCAPCLRVWVTVTGDERDRWKRLFNRLDGAVSHHRNADRFKDTHDDALYAAQRKVYEAAQGGKG